MKLHLLIFILITTLWSLSLYFYNNPFLVDIQVWLKITACLTIIAVFNLFYFVIASKSSIKKFKVPLITAAIPVLIIVLTVFINDFLGIEKYLTGLGPEAVVFLLLFFAYAGLGMAILLERILPGSASNHLQTVYVLIIFAVFLIAITVIYVLLPLIDGSKQYLWLVPLSTVIFLLFFILGHRLIKKTGEEFEKKEESEKLAEEWKKLTQTKDQFLLSLQHHLRTPLTPFKIYLERILDGTYGREENPVIREKLIEMKQLLNVLYSLIESLLDIQELKIGKKILNLEDCKIESLIEGVIEELRPQAEQKGLYLVFEPAEEEKSIIIKADKKRTREAIWNLVDNAIKYTKKGGVMIKLEIAETLSHLPPSLVSPRSAVEDEKTQPSDSWAEPRFFEKGRMLKIIISDTGIGMTEEEIDNFLKGELFNRGEEAKKLYGPGRGIGLTIATEFIKAQDGRVGAESEGPGKGTTFWIKLPIK